MVLDPTANRVTARSWEFKSLTIRLYFGELAELAIALVSKTSVRKDFWVRIPGSPLHILVS